MTRNLKALGPALLAALAMSALAAPGASAEEHPVFTAEGAAANEHPVFTAENAVANEHPVFTAEGHDVELTAEALEPQLFTAGESKVVCENVELAETVVGAEETEITVTPTYPNPEHTTQCEALGFPATIDIHECDYLFTATGSMHIQCPEGKQIEITATILGAIRKCIDIPAQTPTEPAVDYVNKGNEAEMDIELVSTVKGIEYTRTGLCGGEELRNDASYEGAVTITGHEGGKQVDMTWDKASHGVLLTAEALEDQVLTAGGAEFVCESLNFDEAFVSAEETEITATPRYPNPEHTEQCEAVGFPATVDINGCHYLFTATGSMHIECPEGKQIEITAYILGAFRNCLDIPAQTPTEPAVDYINKGNEAEMDIELVSTVEGITYTKTGLCGSTHGDDATYEGTATVTAEDEEGKPVDVTWDKTVSLTAEALTNQVLLGSGSEYATCTVVEFDETFISAEETEITATPTYPNPEHTSQCEALGFPATIDMNECHYLFTATGSMHIECPEGKQIEITAYILGAFRKCLDIPAQTPTEPAVDYVNSGTAEAMDIELVSTIEGLTYTKTGLCGSTHGNDLAYEGAVTITGHERGKAGDVTWDE